MRVVVAYDISKDRSRNKVAGVLAVQQFVAATELSPLAQREALKWMKNKGFIS